MLNFSVLMVTLVVLLAVVLLEVVGTIWIGLDQCKYEDVNGMLWTILNAIFAPVGLIGYVINRHMVKKEAKKNNEYIVEA